MQSKVEQFLVKETDGFKDLIYNGSAAISTNKIVFELKGEIINYPTKTSIQIGPNEHIEDELGQFINHHCYPNTR